MLIKPLTARRRRCSVSASVTPPLKWYQGALSGNQAKGSRARYRRHTVQAKNLFRAWPAHNKSPNAPKAGDRIAALAVDFTLSHSLSLLPCRGNTGRQARAGKRESGHHALALLQDRRPGSGPWRKAGLRGPTLSHSHASGQSDSKEEELCGLWP